MSDREERIMALLSADNPKSRQHREERADGWSSWKCIPIKDVVESGARDALLAAEPLYVADPLTPEEEEEEEEFLSNLRRYFIPSEAWQDTPESLWAYVEHDVRALAARAVPAGLDVERLREALRQAEWEFSRLGRDNFALLMREALDGHPGGTKNIGRPAAKGERP